MQYDEFVARLGQRNDIDNPEQVSTIVLEELGRRLAGQEPSNPAAQLPAELKQPLTKHTGAAETFDVDEFFRRIADREGSGLGPDYTLVNAPADRCYAWWRPLTHLPEIMPDIVNISPHDTEADRTHWTVRGPAETKLNWDARIVEDVSGQKMAWSTVDSSNPAVPNSGVMRFDDKGDGRTGVELSLTYETPGGMLGEAAATLFDDPQRKVEDAVDAFRQTMEHTTR